MSVRHSPFPTVPEDDTDPSNVFEPGCLPSGSSSSVDADEHLTCLVNADKVLARLRQSGPKNVVEK